MSGSNVELDVEVITETESAMLVIIDGDEETWIPKSMIKETDERKGVITSIFIPEWWALEKGFI